MSSEHSGSSANTAEDSKGRGFFQRHFPVCLRILTFLFGWLFKSSSSSPEQDKQKLDDDAAPVVVVEQSLWARMRQGLAKTRGGLAEGLAGLLSGRQAVDDELLEEVEGQLLMADVGLDASTRVIEELKERVRRQPPQNSDALYRVLQECLQDILAPAEQPLVLPEASKPAVILVVGVNGVGKTTTIGKLAKRFQQQGKSVVLAAGDTFRAAAVEQLQVWGERNNIPVIAQHQGADSASVIFDAIKSAKARKADILIADTAGRLHNKSNLMTELAKVRRVMQQIDPEAPHEVLLVLDAGTGQNAINQASEFRDAAGVTGIVLTKLDGTAKGGVIFALTEKFGLPVRFIGVGEQLDDLQPFSAQRFIQALFGKEGN